MSRERSIVQLERGRVGFYDELTGVHLTISRPQAEVFPYMNLSGIKRAVANRTLLLVSGTLDFEKAPVKKDMHLDEEKLRQATLETARLQQEEKEKARTIIEKEEVKIVEPAVEPVAEPEAAEEAAEEVITEEVVTEEASEETKEVATKSKKSKSKK